MSEEKTILPRLDESKLYALARQEQLLSALIPDISTQMSVEMEIDEIFPREADDKQHTRILINYRNIKGNAQLYKFVDSERLERRFGVDGFMDGFMRSIQKDEAGNDVSLDKINATINAALVVAVTTILGLNDQAGMTRNTEDVSKVLLPALTAILFNDALDIMVAIQEKPLTEGQKTPEIYIAGLWIIKQRHLQTVAETSDLLH